MKATLAEIYEAARERDLRERTPETRAAAIRASAALSAHEERVNAIFAHEMRKARR